MSGKKRADVILRAQTRKYKQDLRDAKRETRRFAKDTKSSLVSGFKGGFGAIASLGTAGGLADIAADVFAFEEQIVRLDIQAKGEADIEGIREATERLSLELGVTRNEALSAGTALVNRLGAAAATADRIDVLTRAQVATGASMEDLALIALKLDRAFGLRSAEEMREGLSALIEVGKQGSVPFNEMAAVIAQRGSQFAKFGKTGKEAAAEIGALIQVAVAGGKAGGFGTAAEAGTGLQAFISQLEQSEDKLRAVGVRVREMGDDGQMHLRPMAEILADIRKKNLVNRRGFTKVFGSVQARDFLAVLLEQEQALGNLTKAGMASNATMEDSATFAQSSAGRMKRAWQGVRMEVEKLFTPERTEQMIEALKLLGQVVGFVVDNWKLLLGALLAVKGAQIGFALLKWARSAKELAGGLGLAQRILQKLGATPTPAGLVPAGAAPGAGTTAIQKAAGGAIAFGTGFSVGQELGSGIVAAKEASFERQKKRQRRALSEMERAVEATNILIEAGAIGADRQIDPELVHSLRVARFAGKELTPLQLAAQTALAGYEVAAPAKVRGGFAGIADTFTEPFRPARTTRRTLVSAGPEHIVEGFAALVEANKAALREAVAEISARPIVVKVNADPIATAVQNAPQNQRSPAP